METRHSVVPNTASCYNSIVTGESSSGRTADSGSVSEGSNPSSPANQEAFRMQKGILKKLSEEIAPLAIFGKQEYRDTDKVLLKPVIGN